MTSWSGFLFLFILGAILVLSMTGLWFTSVMPGIDRWNKRFFQAFYHSYAWRTFRAL